MSLRSHPSRLPSLLFLLVLLAWSLVGCGGGGGGRKGTPTSPGGGGGGTVADEQRFAAIQATEATCRQLSQQGLSKEAFDQALKTAMEANPAYKSVGMNAEEHTVWGVFADGRIHMIADNYEPKKNGSGGPAFAAGRSVYLPEAKKALITHSFGTNFEGQTPVTEVTQWMNANGYSVQGNGEGNASLDVLRAVQNMGFLYINTHGMRVDAAGTSTYTYGVQSSTLSSIFKDWEPAIRDDLNHGRLAYMTARNGDTLIGNIPDWDTRYAITAAFVDKYWSFAPNSIVWINACHSAFTSASEGAGGFIFNCHKKGAGVYFGWSQLLGSERAYHSIQYFSDRLLGENKFEPENPFQRPFDWKEILVDMGKKGYDFDTTTGAKLIAFPKPGGETPQILSPTIERMLVDERRDRLVLLGGFGKKQGKATIDGTDVPVALWTNEKVELELPRDGAGSCGPVKLEVDDHESNVRNLTAWRFTIPYEYTLPGLVGPKVSGPINLRFRGDVGGYRLKPGEAPVYRPLWAIATRDSGADFTGSGTFTSGDGSLTWTGFQHFGMREYGPLDHFLVARLFVDPATHKGSLALTIGTDPGKGLFTAIARGPGGTSEHQFATIIGILDGAKMFEDPVEGNGIPAVPFSALNVTFGNDWGLQAVSHSSQLQVKMNVPATAADFPPAANAARSR